jgi:hypothetical protein
MQVSALLFLSAQPRNAVLHDNPASVTVLQPDLLDRSGAAGGVGGLARPTLFVRPLRLPEA